MTFIAMQGFKLVPSLTPLPCLADVLKIIPKDPHIRTLIQIPQLLLTTIFTYNKAEGFVFLQMLISVFSAGLSLEGHWYQNGVKIKMNERSKPHPFLMSLALNAYM